MPKVTYITRSGDQIVVENTSDNLMVAAVKAEVPGIEGACGGVCSCATCHVKIKPEWLEQTGEASETEKDVLEFEEGFDDRSRLSCQIEMTDALDGLVVEVMNEG